MLKPSKPSDLEKENIATTGVRLATEWLKANTKKPKESARLKKGLKKRVETRKKLARLASEVKKPDLPAKKVKENSEKKSILDQLKIKLGNFEMSPERQKLEQQLYEIERQYLRFGKPGFENGIKNFQSKYIRLSKQASNKSKEGIKGTEIYSKRLEIAKLAIAKYNLPKRFLGILFATMRYESNYGEVMYNEGNNGSDATGLGQFIWGTWKKFLKSIQGDPYFEQIKKAGHTPNRLNEVFMIHAMAWHFRRSIDYLKSPAYALLINKVNKKNGLPQTARPLTEKEATKKMTPEYTYLTYHDGDKGGALFDQYVAGGRKDPSLLVYNFQKGDQRTDWMINYSNKVGQLARDQYSEFGTHPKKA